MRLFNCAIGISLLFISLSAHATKPNSNLTPGFLCSQQDPDFLGFAYPSHVARCNRNVQQPEKLQVAQQYGGIPQSQWPNYEFDHLYPLCVGGSNNIKNLWPQPIVEAHDKDILENQICLELQAGTLDQAGAIKKVQDWISQH